MSTLLTFNGVPPQIIGSLTLEQRDLLVHFPWPEQGWQPPATIYDRHSPAQNFAVFANRATQAFVEWGAQIIEPTTIAVKVDNLTIGEATFNGRDRQLHSDIYSGLSEFQQKNILTVRLLCVSSMPATFIDLADESDIQALLDKHRSNIDPRLYQPSLLEAAQQAGRTMCPKEWDIVIFDGTTPHQPMLATKPHRRIFQQAFTKIQLPENWQKRRAVGDAPRFGPI